MATSMEADLEVLFKEKREGKGVKAETAVDNATLRFDFRASTPATSPPGRGVEHRGWDDEEQRRIELKKFSLRPEKYDGKGDFEGWVNQFEEYANLGPPSTIRLPHTKGTTPEREATPTDSELARSEHGESGQEEGEVTQAEGDEPGSFTQMKSRDKDSESEDTTPGRDSWRSARGREMVMLTTPRTRGRGKRRMERGGGTKKRPRMEESSSEHRDESEEPPHRPPPPSTSPHRSLCLSHSSATGKW